MRASRFFIPFFTRLFLPALFFLLPQMVCSQNIDSLSRNTDSVAAVSDSSPASGNTSAMVDSMLLEMQAIKKQITSTPAFLRELPVPVKISVKQKEVRQPEGLFYIILLAALLLGALKISFPSYFNNLFRVFFNTSLRQIQLTDQLLQAMLPSIFFNIYFFITGGLFIYLLLGYYGKLDPWDDLHYLPVCMGGLLAVYLLKFLWMKFLGWVSSMEESFNSYIFIVYLINKMIGICLLPLLPVIAFSERRIASVAVLISVMMTGFMLTVRFLRSYSLAATRMRIPTVHFILYIIALELLPLLILMRVAALLLEKNL